MSSRSAASPHSTPLLRSSSIMTRHGKLTPHAQSTRGQTRRAPATRLTVWARRHRPCMIAGVVLLGAILCMALLYRPAPPDVTMQGDDMASVSKWATKADACSGGYTVADMQLNVSTACGDANGQNVVTYKCVAPQLTWKSYATAAVTITALLFMVNNNPPDIVMLTATVVLLLLKIIDQTDAWSGFSTPGVMAVAVLFVVARGLQEVGVVDLLLKSVLGSPSSLFVAQIRLLFPVAVISAFMNNTPVVAMMIPIVESWSARIGFAKSKFLIPLSFASMLGGMCTLIGTSTNLILAALILKDDPTQAIGMFDMTPVGLPLLFLGILYMSVATRWLMPDTRAEDQVQAKHEKLFQAFFVVPANSPLQNRTLKQTGLVSLHGLTVANVTRDEDTFPATPDTQLQAGDRLLVEGIPEALAKLRRQRGIQLDSAQVLQLGTRRRRRVLVEAILSMSNPLIGHTAVSCDAIMRKYEAAIVAVRPAGAVARAGPRSGDLLPTSRSVGSGRAKAMSVSLDRGHNHSANSAPSPVPKRSPNMSPLLTPRPVRLQLGDAELRTVFAAGDSLVLEVYHSFIELYMHSSEFALVRLVDDSRPPRVDTVMDKLRAVVASLCLIAMVVAAAVGVVSLLTAALCAALIMVACNVLTVDDAFRAIRARVIVAIVCTFGLGIALQNTGMAGFLASALVNGALQIGEGFLLFSIFLVACIAGSVVSNNANVILMYPICVQASQLVPGIPLKQFCIVLMMASSMSFLTPIGYQTNLMVMTPGGYRFTDYAKLGGIMQLLLGMAAVVLTRHFVA